MGIEDAIRAANTGEIGMRFVRSDGSPAASFPMNAPGEIDGPTAELEILRGELSRILIEHTRDQTDYRFDTQIGDLTDHGDHVTATLDDGTTIDADLVVIAEGLRSRTRRFVTTADVTDLGMYFAYLTVPRHDTDDQWWNWQHAPGSPGRAPAARQPRHYSRHPDVRLRRARLGGPRPCRPDRHLAADLRRRRRRRHAHPRRTRRRARCTSTRSAQVRTPHWSKGRIALLGDAAFCNATFGGVGTSLALIGAYVLAGELSRTDDHRAALTRYEHFMRLHAESAGQVSPNVLRRANPRTRAGIQALHAGARLVASPAGRTTMKLLGKRLVHVAADDIRLPDYSDVPVTTSPSAPPG